LPDIYQPGEVSREALAAGQADIDPFDDLCFDEIDTCDEEEQLLAAGSGRFNSDRGDSFIGLWPWVLGVLGALAASAGIIRWFWRRFMAAPGNPEVAFQRMTTLASLASAGPADFQTPYQFGYQLQKVLPAQETPVSIIVTSYVRSRYGNKTLTVSEQQSLAEAWQRLRLPMLWAVITRRVR